MHMHMTWILVFCFLLYVRFALHLTNTCILSAFEHGYIATHHCMDWILLVRSYASMHDLHFEIMITGDMLPHDTDVRW